MPSEDAIAQPPRNLSSNPQLKRKRDDSEVRSLRVAVDTISLKPTGPTTSAKARLFSPTCLLPRAQLPLAWLDPTADGVQLLTGSIELLERKEKDSVLVVVARDVSSGRYWAIEGASHRTYALCRLASTVERRVLEKRSVIKYDVRPEMQMKSLGGDKAVVEVQRKRQHLLTPPPHASSPSLEQMEASDAARGPSLQPLDPAPGGTLHRHPDSNQMQLSAKDQHMSLADVLQDLCKHYLDTLYLSRTSVAYFVKGPLSRARNAVNDTAGSDLILCGLVAFLREMLLTTSTSDKRMKESLPALIRDLTENSNFVDGDVTKSSSRKTKWRAKRDRSGLLSDEKQHVEQWWQNIDHDSSLDVAPTFLASHLDHRLQYIRNRETFLQIIILLETMAIESSSSASPALQATETQVVTKDSQSIVSADKKRSKRPLDLQTHLEGLLDRLTIWHSLDFRSPQPKSEDDASQNDVKVDDDLRSFCVEVVVPFYMSRLPKVAAFVNRRLGGPSAPSKRTVSKRPGEPARRRSSPEKKARRPLHRVVTDSLIERGKTPPSLSRSVTDSQLQGGSRIKRELSVSLSLHSIPLARSDSQRQRLSALASLSRREIDLTAVSAATESKLRKKAEQEARVKEAVASIRRPDRALALKENAARVDAKFAENLPGLKRPHSHGQQSLNVDIAATPHVARQIAATPRKLAGRTNSYQSAELTGLSAAYLAPPVDVHADRLLSVPQTGHRERVVSYDVATPSARRSGARVRATTVPAELIESPILQRASRIDCTPSAPRMPFTLAETPIVSSANRGGDNSSTPVHAQVIPMLLEKSPNLTITTTPVIEKSMYDILGWNDEAYEELA